MMKIGIDFNNSNSILGCRVIQDFGLRKLDNLWRHKVDTK